MESAENRDQSPNVNPPEASDNPQSLSKVETIRLLNESIDRLESTIKDISKTSGKNLPSSESIKTLIDTTQELAEAVTSPVTEADTAPEKVSEVTEAATAEAITTNQTAASSPVKTVEPSPKTKKPPSPQTTAPSSKNTNKKSTPTPEQKQENRALTIIGIVAVAIAIIAVIWLWFLPREIVISETTIIEPTTEITNSGQEEVKIPSLEQPSTPQPEPSPTNKTAANPELIPQPSEAVEIVVDTSIPPNLTSPGKAQNLKITTIEPELTFTSEQTLVSSLQTKLTELIASYDEDLFSKIYINLPTNSMKVQVTDNWYTLSESRQTKMANEILNRSRKLKFSKLELQDSTGTILARNPVVGEEIIILHSQKE